MAGLPISVIDDDELTRMALAGLLRLLGFDARTYGSAEEFLSIGSLQPSRIRELGGRRDGAPPMASSRPYG